MANASHAEAVQMSDGILWRTFTRKFWCWQSLERDHIDYPFSNVRMGMSY